MGGLLFLCFNHGLCGFSFSRSLSKGAECAGIAQCRLRVAQDDKLDLSQPHEKLAEAVGALLADGARLAAVAAAARERALAWNETAFGAELATMLEALAETAGGEGAED